MSSARDGRRLMARSRLSGGRRRDGNHRSLARGRCPAARRRRSNAHGRGCRKNVENLVERRMGAAQCLLGRLANRRPPVQAGGTTVQDISGRPPRHGATGRRRARGSVGKPRARAHTDPSGRAKSPCRKRLMANATPRWPLRSRGARSPRLERITPELRCRAMRFTPYGGASREGPDRSVSERIAVFKALPSGSGIPPFTVRRLLPHERLAASESAWREGRRPTRGFAGTPSG